MNMIEYVGLKKVTPLIHHRTYFAPFKDRILETKNKIPI